MKLALQAAYWFTATVLVGAPALAPTQYQRHSWGPRDGLPEEMISRIQQTRDGYLWLATADGMIRFDGHEFDVFRPPRNNPGSSTRIEGAALEADQSLVLAVVNRGLFRFRNGSYQPIDTNVAVAAPVLLASDPGGGPPVFVAKENMYLVGQKGLELWRKLRKGPTPTSLAAYGRNWLVGYGDGRVLVVGNREDEPRWLEAQGSPHAILPTPEGWIWVGTEKGLFRYQRVGERYMLNRQFGAGRTVSALLRDRNGNVWVGTNEGLAVVWRDQWTDFTPMPTESIGALFEDSERGIWVSYANGRLFRLNEPRFPSWGDTEGMTGRLMALDSSDPVNIWIAAERGLVRWRNGTLEAIPGPWPEVPPRLVLRDQQGSVLVLGMKGLVRVDEASLRTREIRLPTGTGQWRVLHRLRSGQIILGNTLMGLFRLEGDNVVPMNTPNMPALTLRTSLAETPDGLLWMSIRYQGLFVLTPKGWAQVGRQHPALQWIHAMAADEGNYLWLALDGGGIGRWTPRGATRGALQQFALPGEARENYVFQIAEDFRGDFWLGLRSGLMRVSKHDLIQRLEGMTRTLNYTAYDVDKGLGSANFGLAYQVVRAGHGHPFWLAHLQGAMRIDPREIRPDLPATPVNIRRVLADNKTVQASSGVVEIPARTGQVQIHFDAPSLAQPLAVRYRYQLEGYQDQPVGPVADRSATFLKVPPGNYRFRVWAQNADGVWNEGGATVNLRVKPAFTQTWYYRGLMGALAMGVLLAAYLARTRWLRHEKRKLEMNVRLRTAELEHARQAAEAAAKSKAEFLALMSHEIRTPLHGVLGTLELLSGSSLKASEREYVDTARRSGEVLLTLLNDVLDLSKLEANRMVLEEAPVNLRGLLTGVREAFLHRAQLKGLMLRAECGDEIPEWIRADEARLRQVLYNLAGNAVKFTDSGEVSIGLSGSVEGGGKWRFVWSVRDTGIGIAPEALERLFRPFTQLDGSATRRFSGSGLGLVICDRLARLMGGSLKVTSELGRGSTFELHVCFESCPAPESAVVPDSPPDVAALPGGRVLLAEDNRVNQLVARRMLEKLGCRVDVANDGVDALACALARTYDLILMDCHMPRMGGVEATEKIRGQAGMNQRTPIIALTASAAASDRELCLRAGMQDVVGKPYGVRELVGVMERYLPDVKQ